MKHKVLASLLSVFITFSVLPEKINADNMAAANNKTDDFVSAFVRKNGAGALLDFESEAGEEAELLDEDPVTGTYGDLTYEISNGIVTILKCDPSAVSVIIPDTIEGYPVTRISRQSFANCNNLEYVKFPDRVTVINYEAFANCSNLKSVELPANLTGIAHGAFKNCFSLTSITIPDKVQIIDTASFSYCANMTEVTLPEGLTTLGDMAFTWCHKLESINIPDSVTEIGENAFNRCYSLKEVHLPASLSVIKRNTFFSCESLTSIDIPSSVKMIKENAFVYCNALENVTLHEGLEIIEQGAFTDCVNLKEIEFPATLMSFTYGFPSCSSLETIRVAEDSPYFTVEDNIVFSKDMEKVVFCPITRAGQYNIPDGVKEIADYAFFGCLKLTDVIIPDSVQTIGAGVFEECSGIKSLTIPEGVHSIGNAAFRNCSGLTSVFLPDTLTTMDTAVFQVCENLKSIRIPASLEKIPAYTFSRCDSLQTVYYSGTQAQWNAVTIEPYNDPLLKAKVFFRPNYEKVEAFVKRLYSKCFSRDADIDGLFTWMNALLTGTLTAAQVVQGFFLSDEMKRRDLTHAEFVDLCYQVMMDREGEEGGMKTWTDCLDAGMSERFILLGFVGSGEFKQICRDYGVTVGKITTTESRDKNYGITAFVARCYSEVLGRTAKPEELNSWCDYIYRNKNTKANAVWMATKGFFNSPEYINKHTSNADYVNTLYRTFLGREAEEDGFNMWVGLLEKGAARDYVMSGFSNSSEFNEIMASYGIR